VNIAESASRLPCALSANGEAVRVRALALRHDAFQAKLAGVVEHGRAVFLDVLVELNARGCNATTAWCSIGVRRRSSPLCSIKVEGEQDDAAIAVPVAQPSMERKPMAVNSSWD
jgi:hypothetical protein